MEYILLFVAGIGVGWGIAFLRLSRMQRDSLAVLAAISDLLSELVCVLEQMAVQQGGDEPNEQ